MEITDSFNSPLPSKSKDALYLGKMHDLDFLGPHNPFRNLSYEQAEKLNLNYHTYSENELLNIQYDLQSIFDLIFPERIFFLTSSGVGNSFFTSVENIKNTSSGSFKLANHVIGHCEKSLQKEKAPPLPILTTILDYIFFTNFRKMAISQKIFEPQGIFYLSHSLCNDFAESLLHFDPSIIINKNGLELELIFSNIEKASRLVRVFTNNAIIVTHYKNKIIISIPLTLHQSEIDLIYRIINIINEG